MALSLPELKRLNHVDKVVIHSVDLSLYLVSVIVDGEEHYLVDSEGRPIKSHNKLELQALFERLSVGEMVLRQQSAYDEMVGQPDREGSNTLEVPLGNRELGSKEPPSLH